MIPCTVYRTRDVYHTCTYFRLSSQTYITNHCQELQILYRHIDTLPYHNCYHITRYRRASLPP